MANPITVKIALAGIVSMLGNFAIYKGNKFRFSVSARIKLKPYLEMLQESLDGIGGIRVFKLQKGSHEHTYCTYIISSKHDLFNILVPDLSGRLIGPKAEVFTQWADLLGRVVDTEDRTKRKVGPLRKRDIPDAQSVFVPPIKKGPHRDAELDEETVRKETIAATKVAGVKSGLSAEEAQRRARLFGGGY